MRELDDTLSSSSKPPDRPLDRPRRSSDGAREGARRDALPEVIPRRARVTWWLGLVLAVGFAALVTPAITAEHWLLRFDAGTVVEHQPAPFTVRAPMLAGASKLRVGGGLVVARGEIATREEAALAAAIAGAMPRGAVVYVAWFALAFALAAMFCHHLRRSAHGRLVRVQVVSLAVIAALAVVVKLVLLSTALSVLVVPVAGLAMVATLALDRIVGLASGVLAALVVSTLAPFDVGLAILLLVQAATAGLVIAEWPRAWARGPGRSRAPGWPWRAALTAGVAAMLCTAAAYPLLTYLQSGRLPSLGDALHSAWLAAVSGPAFAAVIAVPLLPLYQRLVGEITQGTLVALEDLGHPLLRQIAERSPGTWQHSLMMANLAEVAANAIGANGRLARVGAYFHDLGKSLQAKYFIENLEAGETSLHDRLPPEASCEAMFAHVTEGIVAARRAGLHERIVDFMHTHHGNGVLEYFWAKCREQGNPHDFSIERFRYPGHPPHSRETAILAICDAVEAASRTLNRPDSAAIDALVQRIVYGKLHLGQLDDSGLSMRDLRQISDSLREAIRQATHGGTAYPRQHAEQDASATAMPYTSTGPRLDSLDRKPARDTARATPAPAMADGDEAFAATADIKDATRPERLQAAPQDAARAAAADPIRRGDRSDRGHRSESAKIRAGTARNAGPDKLEMLEEPRRAAIATRDRPDADADADADAWSKETPVVAPSDAELRILLGQPDPTRQQPSADIALLQRHAAVLSSDAPRRSPHPTAEVDPDDIEAAIELAPPARRATYARLLAAAKPKKPPNKAE